MSDPTPREPEDVRAHHEPSDPFERAAPEEVSRQRDLLRDEVHDLREQLRHSPTRARELENRVLQLQTSLATLSTQNERLVRTLRRRASRSSRSSPRWTGWPSRPAHTG